MTEAKFLLIREIGAGMWNEIHHVLTQLLAAEIMKRIPVVYWGKGCLYSSSDGSNAFEQFFLPVSDHSVQDLAKEEFSFYPEQWNSDNILMPVSVYSDDAGHVASSEYPLSRLDADVCIRDKYIDMEKIIPLIPKEHPLFGLTRRDLFYRLICRHIHLQKEVRDFIDSFYDENMKGTPFLAVHIRSSDKIVEVRHLHELNEQYPGEIEKVLHENPGIRIFLMTDCFEILEEYKKRYGNLLIHTDCKRVPKNGQGAHFQQYPDNKLKGYEIIRDSWLAAKCDFFIGNGYSNVSLGISELKNWKADRIKLLY